MNWIVVTPSKVVLNGKDLIVNYRESDLITHIYKTYINDYPKFYKMDVQCKLSFAASELLLKSEAASNKPENEGWAVVLFNRVSSLHADTEYQKTIQTPDNYFPSPAVFVYTLPNITTGEIAIRNRYYGETSFYVLKELDPSLIVENIIMTFDDNQTSSVLAGWIDCVDNDHFEAILFIVERDMISDKDNLAAQLSDLKGMLSSM